MKYRQATSIALFLALTLITGQGFAQEAIPVALGKDLDQYRLQRLQEKVFVHTDKEFYLAGEICWYKLYVVDASFHQPLDLSKVAYLEWLDKDNKPVMQAKIGLSKGHGDGSLYLPLTLRSGNYKLRAYTNWMKNYGVDWFFEKELTIVNARKSAEVPEKPAPLQYNVTFFPEGGNLVENISSKIAFRITDQYGKGVECTGVVTEDDEDTVVRFGYLPVIRARIALSQGNPAKAIELLQAATPYELGASRFLFGALYPIYVRGEALLAADLLDGQGISCRVLSVHTIKPLDVQTLAAAATGTQACGASVLSGAVPQAADSSAPTAQTMWRNVRIESLP